MERSAQRIDGARYGVSLPCQGHRSRRADAAPLARMRESVMTFGLRTLLAGIIDYAGIFPPARLPLEQAIRNYARYRQGPASWMLGRFVCPAAQLTPLAPLIDELF